MRYLPVCLLLCGLTASQVLLPPQASGQIALKSNDSNQKMTFVVKIFELPRDASPGSEDVNGWTQLVKTLTGQNKATLISDTRLNVLSGGKGYADNQMDINISNGKGTTMTLRAGTTVEVEASVRSDGKILTNFYMESSIPADTSAIAGVAPNMTRQKMRTTLLLENGQTAYLQNGTTGASSPKQWVLFITASLK